MAVVALSALAAACVQATTGLGFALVLGPALFALLDPKPAIVALTALGITMNVLVLAGERRRPRVAWREVGPILAAAAPGAVLGVVVLGALPKAGLQLAVGVAVLAAAGLRVRAARRPLAVRPGPGAAPARLALGFASGTLTTTAGVNGPPLALWLTARGLGPVELRDTLCAAFLGLGVIGAIALAPLMAAGGSGLPPATLLPALACVAAGHALGRRAFARLDGRRYEPLLLGVIAVAGIASVVSGATGL
jgi:uncharacterized membrane protein YfcA